MCTSFVANALKRRRKILFAAFDYDPVLAGKYFESIGLDFKSYVDDGRLIIMDGYDITYKLMGISRSVDIENLRIITSDEIISTFQKEVLDRYNLRPDEPISYVMDSFTALSPLIDVRSAYHLTMEICNSIRKQGLSALLVAHEGVLEGNLVHALTRSVDGIIRLRMLWQKTGLAREFLIEKQPFGAMQDPSGEYEITTDGIRINRNVGRNQTEVDDGLSKFSTVRSNHENSFPSQEGRVSTGIPELNLRLQGGFPRGTFICLKGDVGTGTSTFCTQFAWSRLQADGRVVYYCADEPPDIVSRRFKNFGWNLEPYLESDRLALVDAFSFLTKELRGTEKRSKDFAVRRRVLTAFMRQEREGVRNTFGRTPVAVIIDSFTALAPYIDLKSSYVLARMIADSARRRDDTFLAVVRTGVVEANSFYACLGTADALIDMRNIWVRRSLLRRMRIDKMAFTSAACQPMEYEITGEGIKLVCNEKP
jgi:KaiC/GvpD/RAD55 family RecA-like ATPase